MNNQGPRPPFKRMKVRQILPVYPPPDPLASPALPLPQRQAPPEAPYTLSTHIVPAAFLRFTAPAPFPPARNLNASKEEKKVWFEQSRDFMIKARSDSARDTDGHPQILWNCVNRYMARRPKEPYKTPHRRFTLFFAHANGFTKEIWEPTLSYLFSSAATHLIDEVWSWESIQHGDASLLNVDSASGSFNGLDNSRDIINFLAYFLPSKARDDAPPVHLARISLGEADERLKKGFVSRSIIHVGHCFGGSSLLAAARFVPALFTSLVVIDPPLLEPFVKDEEDKTAKLFAWALNCCDEWASRDEAAKSFKETAYFRGWDCAALDVHIECALCATPSGTVRLKTTSILEAIVFMDALSMQEAFQHTSEIDERISLRFIMPGNPGIEIFVGSEKRLRLRPGNTTSTKIRTAGHLIPQEAPRELAEDLCSYLLEAAKASRAKRCQHKAHL